MKRLIAALALVALSTPALAQSGALWQQAAGASHYFSAASTNSTLVQAGPRILAGFVATNTTTTAYYLKFYDKATAPTCNTDVPVFTIAVPSQPAGTTVGQISVWPYAGFAFLNGVGFCITGAAADADNTNAATGITLSLGVK
jgi:hypothetical protein